MTDLQPQVSVFMPLFQCVSPPPVLPEEVHVSLGGHAAEGMCPRCGRCTECQQTISMVAEDRRDSQGTAPHSSSIPGRRFADTLHHTAWEPYWLTPLVSNDTFAVCVCRFSPYHSGFPCLLLQSKNVQLCKIVSLNGPQCMYVCVVLEA